MDHSRIEKYFLERLRDQLVYIPINEALDFNDRKEIQKMIRGDINSKRFRQEIDRAFKQDFNDALRAAFGINSRGNLSGYVVDEISSELQSMKTKQAIAEVCKDVIAKLYREIALRYPFIIKNLRL